MAGTTGGMSPAFDEYWHRTYYSQKKLSTLLEWREELQEGIARRNTDLTHRLSILEAATNRLGILESVIKERQSRSRGDVIDRMSIQELELRAAALENSAKQVDRDMAFIMRRELIRRRKGGTVDSPYKAPAPTPDLQPLADELGSLTGTFRRDGDHTTLAVVLALLYIGSALVRLADAAETWVHNHQ